MNARYSELLHSTDAYSRETVERIGPVANNIWCDYVWPSIRHKITATLKATTREISARPRSFEFLGNYSIISDYVLSF